MNPPLNKNHCWNMAISNQLRSSYLKDCPYDLFIEMYHWKSRSLKVEGEICGNESYQRDISVSFFPFLIRIVTSIKFQCIIFTSSLLEIFVVFYCTTVGQFVFHPSHYPMPCRGILEDLLKIPSYFSIRVNGVGYLN